MKNNVVSFWTEARIYNLKQDWDDGYTCSQIAERLGTSRNAVIGKAHRLNLTERRHGNGYTRPKEPIPLNPEGQTQRSRDRAVFQCRERKPRLSVPNPNKTPPLVAVVSNITGNFIRLKKPRVPRINVEMTKDQLRAMLAAAVQNTAMLENLQGSES